LKRYRLSAFDRAYVGIAYGSTAFLSLSIVLPFLLIFIQSVTPRAALNGEYYGLLPRQVSFQAYEYLLLRTGGIRAAFANSFFLVLVGGGLSLALTCMAAYPLSKPYLPYRRGLTVFLYVPMLVSGGLIPTFMMVRFLGLYGALWACVAVGLVSPWYTFLMRNFFKQVPDSLEEAAVLDGANDADIFLRIMLPLSLPAIATIGLFYAVGQWNSWFAPLLYLKDQSQWPLQAVVRNMLQSFDISRAENQALMEDLFLNQPADNVKKAAVFITTLPVLMFYPFAQKYFVTGLIVGSIKG